MAGGGKRRPAKLENVLGLARACLGAGRYRDTRHAEVRKHQRQITLPEVLEVVRGGYREPAKDEYKPEWKAWNYAIRGKTIDRRELRIAVSFDEEGFLIFITSIDLGE